MKWLLNLLNFLKSKEKTLSNDLSQFDTIIPQLYTRLKGYDYNLVMVWAFGVNWNTIPFSQLITTFVTRHPEFKTTDIKSIIINSILDIIDLYGSTVQNKNG